MTNVTVIGAQWGDEGKGKIVDWLAEKADVVARFQGGHNAGHTLVIGNQVYKLHLLPSGIVRKGKLSIIGNGVVIDPWALLAEIETLRGQGVEVSPDNLLVSEAAPLILPLHGAIDRALEEARGASKIGTTGRGIGPAYEDKVGRRALRVCDLAHPETLGKKLESALMYHNALLKGLGAAPLDASALVKSLADIAPQITPYAGSCWQALDRARNDNKKILFEGAQGIMLDVDHGTYPFVTSSNTVAANAATGTGTSKPGTVLGITKAYTTRVGSGPFPTELDDDIGETLGQRGHEFGTTTGRKRRCGWFDAVQVRQAVKTGGLDHLVLTKLDVMDTLEEIKICVAYEARGKKYGYLPASADLQAEVKPVYETVPGWKTSIQGARTFKDLPNNAVKYIRRIEELTGATTAAISTSPERDDTILVKNLF